jgi:hypothetical protein
MNYKFGFVGEPCGALPAPHQAVTALDPLLRKLLDALKELASRCCLKEAKLCPFCFWPASKDANPDAKHRESGE